jgi:spermidine synthase
VPLAIYLISFIVVFGKSGWRPPPLVGRAMSLVVIALVVALIIGATHPGWLLIPLHLGVFAVACLICHGELAADRPAPAKLTEFYLIMSLGGVLGGALNALVAPVVFDGVWEYPLVMILACMLRPTSAKEDASSDPPWARFVPLGVLATAFASFFVADWLDVEMNQLTVVMVFGPAAIFAYSQVERPARFAAGALALLLAGMSFSGVYGRTLYQSRNFFGVVRVTEQHDTHRVLVHGNTIHGRVLLSELDDDGECVPLAYYAQSGSVGSIFGGFRQSDVPREVGVVGLGVGSQACYARDDEAWTYYEIDPEVVKIATEPGWFNVLDKSEAAESKFVVGDARVQLEHADPAPAYGLLIIDAFSSDSIPVHLMTVEAVELYFERLADDGVLAVHISNRFMNLAPVLGAIVEAEGLSAFEWHDQAVSREQSRRGKEPSHWVVIARSKANLAPIIDDPDAGWQPLSGDPADVWTDDFSDVISTLR